MNKIRDSVDTAWQWTNKEAVMTEEVMRGVRISILDCVLFGEARQRGLGQILPIIRKVIYACELTAEPRLQEPIFITEITAPRDAMGSIYSFLTLRRGTIIEEEKIYGTPMSIVKAYLPISESFGFTDHLRILTDGQAFHQYIFDHWDTIKGSRFQANPKSSEIVNAIRKRKGLKEGIPDVNLFLDKL
ncbi:hypothetical protein ABPG72_010451 [Tetrahymena utriculariae]